MGKPSPTTDIKAARRHHRQHGDMDGSICLLSECALHYPVPDPCCHADKDGNWYQHKGEPCPC